MAVEAAPAPGGRQSVWGDPRFRGLIFQGLFLVAVVVILSFIIQNTAQNLADAGIASGFGFLSQTAGYDVGWSLIPYSSRDTHARAFLVGLLNTLFVSGLGIVLATVMGFVVGVLRLSPNWLVNRVAYWFVEIVRNVPLLLQIFFWYALFLALPAARQSLDLGGNMFLSNRGLRVPAPVVEPVFWAIPAAFVIGIVATVLIRRWARRRQAATGQIFPTLPWGIGLIVGLPVVVALLTGLPWTWEVPVLRGFNYAGGVNIGPELVALLTALSVYTAAFIAENVRGGILSVSHGQTEAAHALGLTQGRTLRLVVIPQALRVIVPPLTSQYLNLTKNSSLGVAIGYPEVVATISGTTLNQTGQAVECVALAMAVYLTISLLISAFMNWYNQHIALVER